MKDHTTLALEALLGEVRRAEAKLDGRAATIRQLREACEQHQQSAVRYLLLADQRNTERAAYRQVAIDLLCSGEPLPMGRSVEDVAADVDAKAAAKDHSLLTAALRKAAALDHRLVFASPHPSRGTVWESMSTRDALARFAKEDEARAASH